MTNAIETAKIADFNDLFRCFLIKFCNGSIGAKSIAVIIQKILNELGKKGMENTISKSAKIQNKEVKCLFITIFLYK